MELLVIVPSPKHAEDVPLLNYDFQQRYWGCNPDIILIPSEYISNYILYISSMIKVVESFLGFKDKKSLILEQRNSILKLMVILNIPSIIILLLVNWKVTEPYMDE